MTEGRIAQDNSTKIERLAYLICRRSKAKNWWVTEIAQNFKIFLAKDKTLAVSFSITFLKYEIRNTLNSLDISCIHGNQWWYKIR